MVTCADVLRLHQLLPSLLSLLSYMLENMEVKQKMSLSLSLNQYFSKSYIQPRDGMLYCTSEMSEGGGF